VTGDLTPLPPPGPPTDPTDPADRAALRRAARADFAGSGLSVRAFCSARGATERAFYTWRENLGLSPVDRPAPPPPDGPSRTFVPVRVVSDAAAEVVLPGGVTLRVPVSADPACVARVVAARRGATC